MHDIVDRLAAWHGSGQPFALATVVRTWSSSPRQSGASMAVNAAGEVVGSVSGGCVEGAVYEVAREVLATGIPRVVTYGVSNGDAFAVGLTCGGIIELFVERIAPGPVDWFAEVTGSVQSSTAVAVVTVIHGEDLVGGHLILHTDAVRGSLGPDELNRGVATQAMGMLETGRTGVLEFGRDGRFCEGEVVVFVESLAPSPIMYVFGAIDFAGAVVRIGKFLGFRVVLCDARPVFAAPARFPEADEVVVSWPHVFLSSAPVDERTVVCVMTHDPKFDIPLLEIALRSPARYIGAMGSRATHMDRLARLRDIGMTEAELDRLSSPIGLDLGARTPEETAVSIAAEFIALVSGGSGQRLRAMDTAIHHQHLTVEPALGSGHQTSVHATSTTATTRS